MTDSAMFNPPCKTKLSTLKTVSPLNIMTNILHDTERVYG